MIDESHFLQTICDNPNDVGPRLVFADYLEEIGQCERSEFIRVGCYIEEIPKEPLRCNHKSEYLDIKHIYKDPVVPVPGCNWCEWFTQYNDVETKLSERDIELLNKPHETGPANYLVWGSPVAQLFNGYQPDNFGWKRGFIEIVAMGWNMWNGYEIGDFRDPVRGDFYPSTSKMEGLYKKLCRVSPITRVVLTSYPNQIAVDPVKMHSEDDAEHRTLVTNWHCDARFEGELTRVQQKWAFSRRDLDIHPNTYAQQLHHVRTNVEAKLPEMAILGALKKKWPNIEFLLRYSQSLTNTIQNYFEAHIERLIVGDPSGQRGS